MSRDGGDDQAGEPVPARFLWWRLRSDVATVDPLAETDEADNVTQAQLRAYPAGYEVEIRMLGPVTDSAGLAPRDAPNRGL